MALTRRGARTASGESGEPATPGSAARAGRSASGAGNVQDAATAAAWDPPLRLVCAALGVPTLALLHRVAAVDPWIGTQLYGCLALSVAAYCLTIYMVPLLARKLAPKLYGVDICKRGLGGAHDGERVPESAGIVSATVLMITVGLLQVCFAGAGSGNGSVNGNGSANGNGNGDGLVLEYNAALLSICFATLLGLMDDVTDIKWKHKLLIAFLMALPLLMSYKGATSILVPRFLQRFLVDPVSQQQSALGELLDALPSVHVGAQGHILDLGLLYYLYMVSLVVFCTNAINIYAGINGLEVGQSVVVALSVVVVNLLELDWRGGSKEDVLGGDGKHHLFSLMLMLPFLATSLGLLAFNWYPARVFVGDVYPYYAGMTIATAAILGHFSKSLLLLVIPQVANFLYSVPQLFHLVPNPRHRLPKVNLATGLLEASKVAPGDPRNNLTLICAALHWFGPMHERTLCLVLLAFQVVCAVVGIFIRVVLIPALF